MQAVQSRELPQLPMTVVTFQLNKRRNEVLRTLYSDVRAVDACTEMATGRLGYVVNTRHERISKAVVVCDGHAI